MKKITLLFYLLFIIFLTYNSSALVIQSVHNSPDKIAPGESSLIYIILKNNEDYDIDQIIVSLDLSNVPIAPYNTGTDYSINKIKSGDSKEVQFKIIILNNAIPGIYKIPINIKYNDEEGKIITKQSLISINVYSSPLIEAKIEDGIVLKGKKNKITVKVINKGLDNAKFLEMSLQKKSNYYSLLSQEKVYIGDVDSNDFQTSDFEIFINNEAPNNIKIPINIGYKDTFNRNYTYNTDLNIRAYSKKDAIKYGLIQNNSIYGIIILAIITVIIIYIFYRIIRRKKIKETQQNLN
ncbi:MAG: hypothetical protein QXW97_00415 [Candidatus Pacearchaeota archaeon]